ncbi:MAG: sulfite exporter TauE/SafE family protein [Cypionkella sp.]
MTLPFDLSPLEALFMGGVFLLAAFVRGYSGFGFSALVVSASALVTNPLYFVAVVMFCEFGLTFQQWRGISRDVNWPVVGVLMLGAAVGLPIGLAIITAVSVDTVRAVVAVYVLAMCAVLLRGWTLRAQGLPITGVVGTFAGAANAVGMAGLPVATFFTAQSMPAAAFRATLIAYFAILDLFSAPLMWWHGLVTWDTIYTAALSAPIIGFGGWVGGRRFLAVAPQDFRRFAIGLLAFLALLGLGKAVL